MIDPMVSLAFSVFSAKGVYALLLGSGVSRSSGIPTGWEITLELAAKLASLTGEDYGTDPAAWYRATFNKEPDYSDLLEVLAHAMGDRNLTLRPYLDPTPEELEQGKKVPTAAHAAIANLVSRGYIRVIVTTNFDQLMERALAAVGVAPSVISNADQVRGMMPLVHSGCTLIKVHGDYTDLRIKNTVGELAEYEPEMNRLLDRVFDDYGLIVCGWSADWDQALRAAFERCPNRRFTTFWSTMRQPSRRAEALCIQRQAQVVVGHGADAFFQELEQKITALEGINSKHPLTVAVAVATLKQYLSEDRFAIKLCDFLLQEADRTKVGIEKVKSAGANQSLLYVDLIKLFPAYEAECETLLALLIAGGFWGRANHATVWVRALERVIRPSESMQGYGVNQFALYPVRYLLNACGIAAVAARNYQTLMLILTLGQTTQQGKITGLWQRLGYSENQHEFNVTAHQLPELSRHREAALSAYLATKLRPHMTDYLSSDREFDDARDKFEYLAGLLFFANERQTNPNQSRVWAPIGLFCRRLSTLFPAIDIEIMKPGQQSPLLQAGAFNGSFEQMSEIKKEFDEWLVEGANQMGW